MTHRRGAQPGTMTLCAVCNKAIQLLRTRNPSTGADIDFWVHFASLDIKGPAETHRAISRRCWYDYDLHDMYGTA
jgi:hypothetical protein